MKRRGVIAIAVVGALLAGLLIYGVTGHGTSSTLDREVAEGKRPQAPDHTLPSLFDDGSGSLASFRGKVVFLNFFASWCEPCEEEAPTLRAFDRSLTSSGANATLLGVSFRDYKPDAQRFLRKYGLDYPTLNDNKLQLASLYGTAALPETFVIDPKGRLVAISRGVVTRKFLDRSLERALRS